MHSIFIFNMTNVAIYGKNKADPEVGEAPPASARPVNADEVLIQNVAVASNPKDWKIPGMFAQVCHLNRRPSN